MTEDASTTLTRSEEQDLVKYMVYLALEALGKRGKKEVNSQIIHSMVFDACEKLNLDVTRSWYIQGPYVPAVEDALVELKLIPERSLIGM